MKLIRIAQVPRLTVNRSYGLPVKVPMVYLRFGLPPEDNRPSRNWLDKKDEKGLSVYRAWFDPKVKKYILQSDDDEDPYGNSIGTLDAFIADSEKKLYLINGKEVGKHGADNEVLLDPQTAKVVKEVSRNDVVEQSQTNHTLSDDYLPPNETPNYDNEPNWEVEDALKDFKMPKVEIRPRVVRKKDHNPRIQNFLFNLYDKFPLDLSSSEGEFELQKKKRLEEIERLKQSGDIPSEYIYVDETVYDIYLNGERHRPEVNYYSYEVAEREVKSAIGYMIWEHKREIKS